ncbi:MAG: cation-transporting P-type ATPase [Deltaproteobacteria bacterium]|nr:cation-transporting P-type ATPase [Deltaproteobacteria bacterium]
MSQPATDPPPWSVVHGEVLQALDVRPADGLGANEVATRRERFGPNILAEFHATSWLTILWRQLRSFVVYLLIAGAALSFALGDHLEGFAILAVIGINTLIGFITELRAVRSTEALRQLGSTETTVRRAGVAQRVPAEDLVPGDIVLFEGGDVVTADVRLVAASRVQSNESLLTGESVPVEKATDVLPAETVIAERENMLFKGTAITKGSAEGVVVSTGMETELGKITALVQTAPDKKTPLEERIDALGKIMGWLCIGLVTIIGILGALSGKEPSEVIKTAIALAVATVPEGLPIVATLALARGVLRMARRNALVEQLSAVETLGSTSVILTDKTGTLTENRMTVTGAVVPGTSAADPTSVDVPLRGEQAETDDDVSRLLVASALCSDASIGVDDEGQEVQVGDPMEVALLVAAREIGLDLQEIIAAEPRLSEEAFDPDIKMMATFHRDGDATRVIVKGAPEAVFRACSSVRTTEGRQTLDEATLAVWREENHRVASDGLRMLAIADRSDRESNDDPYCDLTLLGLVALSDPPRSDVVQAIEQSHRAGVDVIMVTGDQAPTAEHIAASVGLIPDADKGNAVTGADLQALLDGGEEGAVKLRDTRVYARTDPEQKLRLIQFFRGEGETVAMIGDGVNDAPALRQSDIGVAMGKRGTQVAREAADMVLQDDRFATIVVAIRQGRIIFRNIRSFVFYLLSCNLSEIITVGLASAVNAPLPILPMQILFLNLVTDVFPALALGVGESGPFIMEHPPRSKSEALLTRRHWARLVGYGLVMSAAVLAGLAIAMLVFDMEVKRAVTVSFLILAGAQLGHVFNMVSPRSGFFFNEVTRNPWIWAANILCVALLVAAVYVPILSEVLGTVEPGKEGWMLVLTLSLAPVLVGQSLRAIGQIRRKHGRQVALEHGETA